MNKYKKLLGNSIIFTLGNFGSKIISIILVPLYTYYLATSEYGTVDIVTTTTNMILPLISLSIYEAVLRFAMDKNESQNSVLTNALIITIFGCAGALIFYPVMRYFNYLSDLLIYAYLILILQAFQLLISQFTRAIGKITVFAVNGIIQTFTLGLSNIVLLVLLNKGIKGYLISIIISNLVSILYLMYSINIVKCISFATINKTLSKTMLRYAVPLIPNAFMWWLVSTSNRYFILHFDGVETNGLYAVANKIPTLLTLFTSIFSQAWQLSAIEEYDSESKSEFYSKTFYYYQALLFIGTSAIIVTLKILMSIAVADEYYIAWRYVPFLLLGVVFSSFSGFLGTNYIAAKDTKGVFKTSMIGGLLSIVINLILVPIIGAIGAGISTIIGFSIMWVLRIIDTKKYINMKINTISLIISITIILLQIAVLFLNLEIMLELSITIALFSILLITYRGILFNLIQIAIGRKK